MQTAIFGQMPVKKLLSIEKEQESKVKDKFLDKITLFFIQKNAAINETMIIKKNSEIDLIVEIPEEHGTKKYYCKAKNKKSINETDLTNAFIKGHGKGLPVFFITSGEATNDAKALLESDLKNGFVFAKLSK